MRTAHSLTEILDLEVIDRDLYRGYNQPAHGPRLYGGQVAAQCLMAAALTIPEGRLPHSLHGYFLRAGKPEWPVILRVDRDRDGRNFSSRHVEAVQQGEVIFTMSASFQVPADGVVFSRAPVDPIEDPDALPEPEDDWGRDRMFDHRLPRGAGDLSRMWVKLHDSVGPDPTVRACALTYLSDYGTAYPDVSYARDGWGGPSLDHAMWFHQPIDVDDWVLLDLVSWAANGGRNLYSGALRDRHRTLGALITQEHLLRSPASR